jgi:hypothetical protein
VVIVVVVVFGLKGPNTITYCVVIVVVVVVVVVIVCTNLQVVLAVISC